MLAFPEDEDEMDIEPCPKNFQNFRDSVQSLEHVKHFWESRAMLRRWSFNNNCFNNTLCTTLSLKSSNRLLYMISFITKYHCILLVHEYLTIRADCYCYNTIIFHYILVKARIRVIQWKRKTSETITFLQGANIISPKCPYFGGSLLWGGQNGHIYVVW